MANKINYNNKAPFQTLEEIPDENKVNANDMNEIKTVVNNNADELDTAKENIESLQNGQGTSNADITNLKNRVSTLETDNTTNKNNINNLQNNKVDKVDGKGLSTEDFTTELKSKLENLENYDDTEIKEDISNLEAEQTEQNEQIDILLNALPTETQEAENINIKGTIPVKFKDFRLSGNSKQETREGKNLTNYKDWITINNVEEITKQEDDEIVCEIPSNNAYGIRDIKRTLKPNTNYTACVDYTFSKPLSQVGTYGIRININGNSTGVMSNGLINFTTDETGLAIMQLYVGFPWSGEAGTLTVKNIRLYEGTYTKETIPEYEEYGAMPSPEYPSEIQNVEGDVNATVSNKNLFKMPNKEETAFNNITYLAENQNIKINGTGTTGKYPWIIITKNNIYNKNGTPTLNDILQWQDGILAIGKITATLKRISGTSDWEINMNLYDESGEVVNNEIADTTKIVAIGLYLGNGKTFNNLILGIQIEKGEIATEYVEHQEQTVTFPLTEGQKLYKGDYLADDGIHHVRNQRELDGTEYWFVSGICYYISIPDKKLRYELTKGKMLCNYFKETIASNSVEAKIGEFFEAFYSSGNRNVMFNYDNGEGGVDNFKSYLAAQKQAGTPVILEYELAEEEIEAYTEEQQEAYNQLCNLTAYEEETNIYSINEVSPVFTVTAVKDINSVITQLNTVLLERS